jgi:exopolyphosphatase/guanosine-5'-triphosphate,3'-diphosphate pyrophosphatase
LPSDSPSPADPTRVAIIDIGTNSTRILVADVSGNHVDEVERISTVTRLGRGVDHSGTLSPEAIEDVCDAIAGYLQLVERLGATRTRVVATSAVRDASNADAFTAELRERFDLVTDVISGDEEARLTYRGAISGRSGTDPLLVLDIGGGSTELIVGEGDTMLFHTSMQAGVVRHTERFITSDPPDPAELENLAADIARLIAEVVEGEDLPAIHEAVGVAGTPSSLAAVDLSLEPYDPEAVEGHPIPIGVAQKWLSRLAAMPLSERREVTGLHPARAEALVAGLVILIEVMRSFSLDEILVSEHDILYGCAIDAASLGA